jgi:hypothetical protein
LQSYPLTHPAQSPVLATNIEAGRSPRTGRKNPRRRESGILVPQNMVMVEPTPRPRPEIWKEKLDIRATVGPVWVEVESPQGRVTDVRFGQADGYMALGDVEAEGGDPHDQVDPDGEEEAGTREAGSTLGAVKIGDIVEEMSHPPRAQEHLLVMPEENVGSLVTNAAKQAQSLTEGNQPEPGRCIPHPNAVI